MVIFICAADVAGAVGGTQVDPAVPEYRVSRDRFSYSPIDALGLIDPSAELGIAEIASAPGSAWTPGSSLELVIRSLALGWRFEALQREQLEIRAALTRTERDSRQEFEREVAERSTDRMPVNAELERLIRTQHPS